MRRAGVACTYAALVGVACSSSSSGSSGISPNVIALPAYNVAEVSVDYGLPGIGYVDGLFAKVTICVPGSTSDCQTIDHVLVDTGSSGLRLFGSVLTLSLPELTDPNGVTLAECTQLMSGSLWGPLRSADFSIANEQVNDLTIQVIDESTYPMPTGCTGTDISDPNDLAANGILGVGWSLQDCGPSCAARVGPSNSGMYFTCSSATADGCKAAAVPVAKQVSNPVAFFSQDNNGTIVELPAIPAEGAPSVMGSLVFGIGTRENNGLGSATVIRLDDSGDFLTKYPTSGSASFAFIDSGSNMMYFSDSSTTRIPTCSDPSLSFLYCPSSTLNLSARVQDAYGMVAFNVDFSVANAMNLFSSPTSQYNIAFDNLAGPDSPPPSGTGDTSAYFDWGLPFHFGRNVFTAIEGQATPGGSGPFAAF
jgi:hypothetical protein